MLALDQRRPAAVVAGQPKKFFLGTASRKSRQEAILEAQSRALHLPAGRRLDCWIGHIASANGDDCRSNTPGQAIPGTGGVSPFAASVPAKLVPGILPLSLTDAIDRGLKQNLGLLLSNADIRAARGQRWEQLSALLPHVTAAPYIAESEINIDEIGFAGLGNRLDISSSIGPYSYFDTRASVTQTLFDWKSINATRAASQSVKSATYTLKDARDLVVLAAGYSYLRAIADAARIETAEAQVETGQALYNSGGRPGECRHFAADRRPAREGRAADPAATVDPGEERLRNPEADPGPRDRSGSRTGIRTDGQVAVPTARRHHASMLPCSAPMLRALITRRR